MLALLDCDSKLMDDAIQERRERRDHRPNDTHGGKAKEFRRRFFDLAIIVGAWLEEHLACFNAHVGLELVIRVVLSGTTDEGMLLEVMKIFTSYESVYKVAPRSFSRCAIEFGGFGKFSHFRFLR